MTDIPLRAIAELERRRQQQLVAADAADHDLREIEARSMANGYGNSIAILKAMRSNGGESDD